MAILALIPSAGGTPVFVARRIGGGQAETTQTVPSEAQILQRVAAEGSRMSKLAAHILALARSSHQLRCFDVVSVIWVEQP